MTGFRTWSTGDSVSAADFTSYIATQSVLIFADASARSTGVASPVNGMVSSLTTDNVISIYNGSAWVDVIDIDTLTVSGGNYTVTGTMTYGASGSGVDVTFHSGTAGDHMTWDASEEKLILEGTNGATVLDVTDGNVVIGDGTLTVGSDGAGEDVTFHSGTAGDYMLWDSSDEKLILEGTNGATVLDITDGNVVIGDGTLTVGSDGAGEDVTFHSDTAGDSMVWDSSAEKLTITGTNGQTALAVADGNVTMADDLAVTGNVTIQSLDMDTIVAGDVIYGSGADTLARLAKGSDDEVLTLASGIPSWEAASAGTAMSGSTANGMLTYHNSTTATVESSATYDGTTLQLTTGGGGLKLDGLNSTNANTLDDYEEGTWTGTMSAAGGGTIGTNSATLGYVKIGKMVWCHGYFNANAASSPAGNAHINTLPFTAEGGSTTMYALATFGIYRTATEQKTIMGTAQQGATHVYLRGRFGETGVYSGNSAEWFANAGSASMDVSVNFCYRAST